MPVTTQVLFGTPQCEIASLIRNRLIRCASASIVSGYITPAGIEAIAAPIRANPNKLATLVIGSGTYKAFEALDRLMAHGLPSSNLFVHLGHTAPRGRNSFFKHHPMLHSKVYLMDMGDGTACAFVGSHNITDFALLGKNGEAAVVLEGPSGAPEFRTIQQHIREARSQAITYSPGMKHALNWWTVQFLDGLRIDANDAPRDTDQTKTIVVLAASSAEPLPKIGDTIYFEIPTELEVYSLKADVHIYVLPAVPATPYAGLASLQYARASFSCVPTGLLKGGGAELETNWFIVSKTDPRLLPATRPFRPNPAPEMLQVCVEVRTPVAARYDYLFDKPGDSWEPVYQNELTASTVTLSRPASSKQDHDPWILVKNLRPAGEKEHPVLEKALFETSPEAGSYVLVSSHRRKR